MYVDDKYGLSQSYQNKKEYNLSHRSEKSLIWIFIDAEIMENNQLENGTFEFVFLECGNPGRISFRYSKFEWCVVGEFNNEQIVQWYKEIRVYSLVAMNITITKVLYKVELSKEYRCVIIGTTHF